MTTHSGTSPFRRERAPISLALFAGLGLVFASPALAGEPRALLQQPTVSKDRIVFVHATDLWSVARNGGAATRLTETIRTAVRREPDATVVAWLDAQPRTSFWTTTVTVFEVRSLSTLASGSIALRVLSMAAAH